MSVTITYLRAGRKLRATGTVVATGGIGGAVKVKPARADWNHVWISQDEATAGSMRPPPRPRQEDPNKPEKDKQQRERRPKSPPIPRWQALVAAVRVLEADHEPLGWPAIRMEDLTALADELVAAHQKLAQFLPL